MIINCLPTEGCLQRPLAPPPSANILLSPVSCATGSDLFLCLTISKAQLLQHDTTADLTSQSLQLNLSSPFSHDTSRAAIILTREQHIASTSTSAVWSAASLTKQQPTSISAAHWQAFKGWPKSTLQPRSITPVSMLVLDRLESSVYDLNTAVLLQQRRARRERRSARSLRGARRGRLQLAFRQVPHLCSDERLLLQWRL